MGWVQRKRKEGDGGTDTVLFLVGYQGRNEGEGGGRKLLVSRSRHKESERLDGGGGGNVEEEEPSILLLRWCHLVVWAAVKEKGGE